MVEITKEQIKHMRSNFKEENNFRECDGESRGCCSCVRACIKTDMLYTWQNWAHCRPFASKIQEETGLSEEEALERAKMSHNSKCTCDKSITLYQFISEAQPGDYFQHAVNYQLIEKLSFDAVLEEKIKTHKERWKAKPPFAVLNPVCWRVKNDLGKEEVVMVSEDSFMGRNSDGDISEAFDNMVKERISMLLSKNPTKKCKK